VGGGVWNGKGKNGKVGERTGNALGVINDMRHTEMTGEDSYRKKEFKTKKRVGGYGKERKRLSEKINQENE